MADNGLHLAEGLKLTPEEQQRQELQNLGPFVHHGWELARDHRKQVGIRDELEQCLRDRSSEYHPNTLSNIKTRLNIDNPVFIPFADLKARTSKTLISEVFLNSSEVPYTLDATPVPDLPDDEVKRLANETMENYVKFRRAELSANGAPPEVVDQLIAQMPPDDLALEEYVKDRKSEIDSRRREEASEYADRMLKKMRDQQIEGNWHEAFMAAVDDVTTYGTCIIMGPVRRKRQRTRWQGDAIKLETVDVLEWEAISPRDSFPTKGAIEIDDGGFFRIVRMTPAELAAMKDLGEGYFPSEIDTILATWPNGGLTLYLDDSTERRLLNDTTSGAQNDTMLQGIETWQSVRGSMLKLQGLTKDADGADLEDTKYYEVNAMVFDKRVVYASVTNPRLGRPLYKGVFYRKRGSWWGYSPLKVMRDPMRIYNAACVDLTVNMALASIPRPVIRDATRIPVGTQLASAPGVPWVFRDPTGGGTQPVDILRVPNNAPALIDTMERFEKLFDTVTGIPSLQHGSDVAAGAGRTYNGLLLIVNASKQGANDVVLSLFNDVMAPALRYQYRYNLLFDDDPSIKGDCEVKPGGLLAILLREQSINRLTDFLNLAQNPNVMKVIGQAGLSELLRQYLSLLPGINSNNVVPSKAEMERRQKLEEIENEMKRAEQAGMALNTMRGQPVGAQPPSVGETGLQGAPSLPSQVPPPAYQEVPMGPQAGMETPEQEGAAQ